MNNNNNYKTVLVIASISSFTTPFMFSGLNVALPAIAREFALNAVSLSWIVSAYAFTAAIFLIPFGRLADIYGRRKIFLFGNIVFTIASFLTIIADSTIFLIISRAIQGIGGSMIFGTGMAILMSSTPTNKKGRALGINVTAVYLGLSSGPPLGGLLTNLFGWRVIFYITIILGLFITYLTISRLKSDWAEAKGESFDIIGSVIYALSFFAIMYGSSHLTDQIGMVALISGFVLLAFFLIWEIKNPVPIINIKYFLSNSVFAFSNLAALINYSATSAVTFLLSLYLQYLKGLTPQEAGLILIAQPLFMALVSPIAGRFSDTSEPRTIASIGMALSAIGLVLFIALNHNTSLIYIISGLTILGLGFGLFSSPNNNAVMSSVTKEYFGVASAILGTMRLTGQMLSIAIVMLVFSIYLGKNKISPENFDLFISSTKLLFVIFTSLCIFGIFASLARGKFRNN